MVVELHPHVIVTASGATAGQNVTVTYAYHPSTGTTTIITNPQRDLDFATNYKLQFEAGTFQYSGGDFVAVASEMTFKKVGILSMSMEKFHKS